MTVAAHPSWVHWAVVGAITILLLVVLWLPMVAFAALLLHIKGPTALVLAAAMAAALCAFILPWHSFGTAGARWIVDFHGVESPSVGRIEFTNVVGLHFGYPFQESIAMTAFQEVIARGVRPQMNETLVLRLSDGRLLPLNLLSPSISGGRAAMAKVAELLAGKRCLHSAYSPQEIAALKSRPMNRLVTP
jgi:hypothetical protein